MDGISDSQVGSGLGDWSELVLLVSRYPVDGVVVVVIGLVVVLVAVYILIAVQK